MKIVQRHPLTGKPCSYAAMLVNASLPWYDCPASALVFKRTTLVSRIQPFLVNHERSSSGDGETAV